MLCASWVQVCAEKKETANEWWGIGLPGLVVGKLWALAQAHLRRSHLLSDFRHFVAVLVLGREGECGHCGGLMDTRRLLFFPSFLSLPSLRGHYLSLCFGEWDKAVVSSVTEMKWMLLCSHICQNLGPLCPPCWELTAQPPKPPPHPWWASLHPHSANEIKTESGLRVFPPMFYILGDFLMSVVWCTCFINQRDSSCPSSKWRWWAPQQYHDCLCCQEEV